MSTIYNGLISQGFDVGFNAQTVTTSNLGNVTEIRLLDAVNFGIQLPIVWYGDTVMMSQLSSLQLPIGSGLGATPFVLTAGYRYLYNVNHSVFTVFDNTGAVIFSKSPITSWADMNISKSVIESHQFELLFTGASSFSDFFIIAYRDLLVNDSKMANDVLWGETEHSISAAYKWDITPRVAENPSNYNIEYNLFNIFTKEDEFGALACANQNIKYSIGFDKDIVPIDDSVMANEVPVVFNGELMDFGWIAPNLSNLLYKIDTPLVNMCGTAVGTSVENSWPMWLIEFNQVNIGLPPEPPDPNMPDDEGNDRDLFALYPNWG